MKTVIPIPSSVTKLLWCLEKVEVRYFTGTKHSYLVRKFFFSYRLSFRCHRRHTWPSVVWTSHQLSFLAHPSVHCVGETIENFETHFRVAFKSIYIKYNRAINQPNVGADVHLSTLQCCVHSQVNGVGGFTAVVLVDEHWVFCDVKACGIPVTRHVTTVRIEINLNYFIL